MPLVRANPNEYLLVGRGGGLENRGSAVQALLWPGTVYVLVPAGKQQAAFEFTQETRDGIPLRFKGIIIYRVIDPAAAARLFDFSDAGGMTAISTLLTQISLGELRHAVSHMTMVECIEERKTTLSEVVATALDKTVRGGGEASAGWGISIEVAQLAQVFIVDAQLRQQLEAEVRNEIKLTSDRSTIATQEQTQLSEMASKDRLEEQKLAGDREALRRAEALELAQLARERRLLAEKVAAERDALQLEQERFHDEAASQADRTKVGTPVRRLEIANDLETSGAELELMQLRAQIEALDVERRMAYPRAEQVLRRAMLEVEQTPDLVASAAKVFNGASLSIYGDDAPLVGQLAPLFGLLGRAVERAGSGRASTAVAEPDEPSARDLWGRPPEANQP